MIMDTNPLLAKIFWYISIIGFFIFFAYKFQYDKLMQKELSKTRMADKLFSKEPLSGHDYDILASIICKLSSKKDTINYFFIFFFSALAVILAAYFDFIRPVLN